MRCAIISCAALVSATAAPSMAVAAADAAEEQSARGDAAAAAGRHELAIDEYRKAYELRADARFLFAIAESYRALAADDRAQFFYRRYLAAAPEGPLAERARVALAELGASADAPASGPPHDSARAGEEQGVPVEDHALTRRSPSLTPPASEVGAQASGGVPPWGRWWLWAGAGTLLLATAALLTITLSGTPERVPTTTLGHWDLRR